jgi:hypothetical protein
MPTKRAVSKVKMTSLPLTLHLRQLAQRMLDLLVERDGAADVERRLADCVRDLEQRRSAGEWVKKEAS